MAELTKAQQRVLDFIKGEVQAGKSVPTQREIADRFGFHSHRAAACHLSAIKRKRKGFLQSEPGRAHSLRVISPLTKLRCMAQSLRASTLKTFVVKGGRPYLKAENPKFTNLIPAEELMIQGVVKAHIRRAKE